MGRDFHLSVSADFIGHVKTRKLVRLLGGDESAPLRLIQFWSWAAEFAPEGDLSEIDIPEIEYGAGHKGTDGQLFKALIAAGFVDDADSGRKIHNWMMPGRTGFAIKAMEKSRARWRRSKGIKTRADEDSTEDSARNHAGNSEDSSGLHGSRFTVHGSQENPPPVGAIPGATGWSAPDVNDPLRPEKIYARSMAMGQEITPHFLGRMFGLVRQSEIKGAIEWVVPRGVEKSQAVADACAEHPEIKADMIPTMRLIFARAKAGLGRRPADVIQDPSFAFGCWCATLTNLQEAVNGKTPSAPVESARATGPPRGPDRTQGNSDALRIAAQSLAGKKGTA